MIKKGKIDEAVLHLMRAIELNTNYVEQAKTDSDFDDIRRDTRFSNLIDKYLNYFILKK